MSQTQVDVAKRRREHLNEYALTCLKLRVQIAHDLKGLEVSAPASDLAQYVAVVVKATARIQVVLSIVTKDLLNRDPTGMNPTVHEVQDACKALTPELFNAPRILRATNQPVSLYATNAVADCARAIELLARINAYLEGAGLGQVLKQQTDSNPDWKNDLYQVLREDHLPKGRDPSEIEVKAAEDHALRILEELGIAYT